MSLEACGKRSCGAGHHPRGVSKELRIFDDRFDWHATFGVFKLELFVEGFDRPAIHVGLVSAAGQPFGSFSFKDAIKFRRELDTPPAEVSVVSTRGARQRWAHSRA
jgi:hypothetical protein